MIEGSCHCGNIRVALATETAIDSIRSRRCGCDFCTRAGARYWSDPKGALTFTVADETRLNRYRFGTGQADFLICRTCGVYVGAIADASVGALAVLNINCLDAADRIPDPIETFDYEGEAPDDRAGRWRDRWTPAAIAISPG